MYQPTKVWRSAGTCQCQRAMASTSRMVPECNKLVVTGYGCNGASSDRRLDDVSLSSCDSIRAYSVTVCKCKDAGDARVCADVLHRPGLAPLYRQHLNGFFMHCRLQEVYNRNNSTSSGVEHRVGDGTMQLLLNAEIVELAFCLNAC
jgi:hypothetical protein